jgi:hypothetical protein
MRGVDAGRRGGCVKIGRGVVYCGIFLSGRFCTVGLVMIWRCIFAWLWDGIKINYIKEDMTLRLTA